MWNLKIATDYIGFVLTAKAPSAMHSPFLFELLPHVFDSQKAYYAFSELEVVRHVLGQSDEIIKGKDIGAGSRKGQTHTIGQFASKAISSPRQCEILFRLTEKLKPAVTIELGCALGISTSYLASAYHGGMVYAFEGNSQFIRTAQQTVESHGLDNVVFVEGEFDTTLQYKLESLPPVDLAFVDGNHKLEPTLRYFNLLCEHAADNAVFIIDDIRWSEDMFRAWNAIVADDRVRISIDAFSFGLVFLSDRFVDRGHFRIAPSLFNGGPVTG